MHDLDNVMRKLNHQRIFPTHIFQMDNFYPYVEELSKVIELGYEQHIPNWQSRPNLHNENNFKNFAEYIIDINKEVIRDNLGYQFDDIKITDMWANVLKPGEYHAPHTHSNNFLSGVFYLQSDDRSAGLEFFDPRAQTGVLCPRIKNGNVMNANAVGFDPRENMGLIFPAWLQHWVKTSNSDERMSVSWNTLTKGHYGGPLGKANAYI